MCKKTGRPEDNPKKNVQYSYELALKLAYYEYFVFVGWSCWLVLELFDKAVVCRTSIFSEYRVSSLHSKILGEITKDQQLVVFVIAVFGEAYMKGS